MKSERKKFILENFITKYKETKKECIKNNIYEKTEDIYGIEEDILKDCIRIDKARYQQIKRLKEHIEYLTLDNNCYFVTFNFNDKALKNSKRYRKQQINNIIKDFDDYIINIDYGKKNKREHYHCIIKGINDIYIKDNHLKSKILDNYKLGYYDIQRVRTNTDRRLANYINKLTMHSVKIEQSYISTKKGSEWQKIKKHIKMSMKKFEKE